MTHRGIVKNRAVALVLPLLVSACGGGSSAGSAVVSTPSPPSSTSTSTSTSTYGQAIFPSPATQQFATLTGGSRDLQVRYDAATRIYSVSVDGAAWQDVRPFNITHNVFGPTENPTFLDVGQPGNFHYSRWLFWAPANTIPTRSVTGIPTPSGGVPTVGAATYSGIMTGNTDAAYTDGLNTYPAQAFGTIALQFDFAAGTLAGTAKPSVYVGDITGTELPPVSFVDTVFSAGSTGFSGKFQTALPGPNAFSGLFTGPAANELIGKWTLPFQWTPDADSALTGDGQIHSIWGVFLAKR